MSNKYIPVPVEIARMIADKYQKAIVIINTWDITHGLLHTTTYGRSLEQKHQAAKGGEIAATALGADMPKADKYQDFRDMPTVPLSQNYEQVGIGFVAIDEKTMLTCDSILVPEIVYKEGSEPQIVGFSIIDRDSLITKDERDKRYGKHNYKAKASI